MTNKRIKKKILKRITARFPLYIKNALERRIYKPYSEKCCLIVDKFLKEEAENVTKQRFFIRRNPIGHYEIDPSITILSYKPKECKTYIQDISDCELLEKDMSGHFMSALDRGFIVPIFEGETLFNTITENWKVF